MNGWVLIVVILLAAMMIAGAIASIGEDGRKAARDAAEADRKDKEFEREIAAYGEKLVRLNPQSAISAMGELERSSHIRSHVSRVRDVGPLILSAQYGTLSGMLAPLANGPKAKRKISAVRAELAAAQLDFDTVASIAGLKADHIAYVERGKSFLELAFKRPS